MNLIVTFPLKFERRKARSVGYKGAVAKLTDRGNVCKTETEF